MNWFFLTVGYSGLAPKAPGTVGTLVSLPIGVVILAYLGPETLFLAAMLLTLAGVKAVNKYQETSNTHDDGRIVIDELMSWLVCGWHSLLPLVSLHPLTSCLSSTTAC